MVWSEYLQSSWVIINKITLFHAKIKSLSIICCIYKVFFMIYLYRHKSIIAIVLIRNIFLDLADDVIWFAYWINQSARHWYLFLVLIQVIHVSRNCSECEFASSRTIFYLSREWSHSNYPIKNIITRVCGNTDCGAIYLVMNSYSKWNLK